MQLSDCIVIGGITLGSFAGQVDGFIIYLKLNHMLDSVGQRKLAAY